MSALAPVLVAAIWSLAVFFIVLRVDALARVALAAWERVTTPAAPERFAPPAIPNDLEALVMSQSERWAQEDVAKTIHEKYEEYGGDWDKVRSAFGLGALS